LDEALKHLWRDVIVGTLGQQFGRLNLDPPCLEEPSSPTPRCIPQELF
jgi:hypothetical protein